jgi:hypothetical protein
MRLRLTFAIALAAAGCAPSIRTVEGPGLQGAAAPPGSPSVPSGARFSIRMSQPLDSAYARPNDPFTAVLIDPLRNDDGVTIANAGAVVRGVVAESRSGAGPNLTLQLDSIETVYGPAPLAATVVDAGTVAYAAPQGLARDAWAGRPLPPGTTTLSPTAPPTAWAEGWPRQTATREVRIPAGATLELVLVRPIVLPAPSPTAR